MDIKNTDTGILNTLRNASAYLIRFPGYCVEIRYAGIPLKIELVHNGSLPYFSRKSRISFELMLETLESLAFENRIEIGERDHNKNHDGYKVWQDGFDFIFKLHFKAFKVTGGRITKLCIYLN
jgi:hypothetical protein